MIGRRSVVLSIPKGVPVMRTVLPVLVANRKDEMLVAYSVYASWRDNGTPSIPMLEMGAGAKLSNPLRVKSGMVELPLGTCLAV